VWFDSWADILRVIIVGAVSYATLVGVLRLSGKRTLGQLNAFDFVVTVVLVVDGRVQEDELRRNRLTESEVLQAVRGSGSGDVSSIAAVVLETNGKLSVVPSSKLGVGSAMSGIAGYPASSA